MPPKQQSDASPAVPGRRRACKALTTSGSRCKRAALPGLTVCKSHGGGTAASVRASKQAEVSRQASLWGISSDAGSISVVEQLEQLARNKMTDIIALRIKISEDPINKHIGMLTETHTLTEYDIMGTVQSKEGTQETKSRRAGTSVWVQELHKTEQEYTQILRLLHEVKGNTDTVDLKRVKMQTAQQVARIVKAFPGISIQDVIAEVGKSA